MALQNEARRAGDAAGPLDLPFPGGIDNQFHNSPSPPFQGIFAPFRREIAEGCFRLATGAIPYEARAVGNGGTERLLAADPACEPAEFTEDKLALDFAKTHAVEMRYVGKWGRWLEWTGSRWQFDDTLNVYTLTRKICRAAAAQCNKPAISAVLAKAKTIAAVEQLARCDDLLKATVAQWDSESGFMNTLGALVDLGAPR